VEQFIRKFEDVATIAEWPASVRLLQLWAYLTDQARSFALGPDEAYIMQALQTRFGLMAEEATDRGGRPWRTTLTQWSDLAQTAFSQAEGDERKCFMYIAFFRTINNPGPQRDWLAAKISSLEEAWRWVSPFSGRWASGGGFHRPSDG